MSIQDETPRLTEEEEYSAWVAYYGSPSYGGWARDPLDGRQKPIAVIKEEGREPA